MSTDGKRWPLSDLVAVTDICKEFKVLQATLSSWIRRYETFPAPLTTVGGRKVFSRRQVTQWFKENVA